MKHKVIVTGYIELSDNHHKLTFSKPEGFSHKAGQFLTICVESNGKQQWRAYSILSPPSQKTLELCFKVIPDGFATPILKQARLGDEFSIKGPLGTFWLDDSSDEHWFIAAGSGVMPFYCILKEFLKNNPLKKFRLVYGARAENDLLFHKEFLQWQKNHKNFTYLPVLSRQHWAGAEGHVQEHLGNDLGYKTFYICGLKQMVFDTIKFLEEKGVGRKRIKFERYS